MADAKLGILISADTQQAQVGLSNLNTAIVKSQTALQKLPQSSNQATLALSNLGRVAQDAPFGFIGIANNLNPLLESFQRLKATTGTTGGALKALGASLTGAGGIGIALSVVSSLLIVFGDRLFGVSKAAKEADEANKKLAQGVAEEAAKLTALVGVITNVNTSSEDRAKGLRAINQEYAQYLPNLNNEQITLENIGRAYDVIIDSLLRQAVVKGLQDEIAKKVEETAKKIIAIERAEQSRAISSEAAAKKRAAIANTEKLQQEGQLTSIEKIGVELNRFNKTQSDQTRNINTSTAATNAAIAATDTYEEVLRRTKDQLKAELAPLLQLTNNFEDLGIKLDKLKDKKVEIKPNFLSPEIIGQIGIPAERLTSNLTSQINSLLKAVGPRVDFGLLTEEVNKQVFAHFNEEFRKFGDVAPTIDLTIDPNINVDLLQKALDDITRRFEVAKTVAQGFSNAFGQAFDSLFSGQNAIQALGNALKQLVIDLIRATIQAFILKAVTNLFLPGSAGAKGVGAGALGALFGRRASGGPVEAGKPYIVGEVGAELFIPRASGTIIPNNSLNNIEGFAQALSVTVVGRISGSDILLSNARQGRYNNRNV